MLYMKSLRNFRQFFFVELFRFRHAEKRNMALLNRYGCAAPLYGTFENGVIYGYVPGRVLDLEDVRDPHLAE